MDQFFLFKLKNVINEMQNQIDNHQIVDSANAKTLMSLAINRISLLLTHVGYLESRIYSLEEKLKSTVESNKMMAVHAENLIAENQRLNQIAKY